MLLNLNHLFNFDDCPCVHQIMPKSLTRLFKKSLQFSISNSVLPSNSQKISHISMTTSVTNFHPHVTPNAGIELNFPYLTAVCKINNIINSSDLCEISIFITCSNWKKNRVIFKGLEVLKLYLDAFSQSSTAVAAGWL